MSSGWAELMGTLDVREPKGKAQCTQYIQDVSTALYQKTKDDLKEDTIKQRDYNSDAFPPSGFIIFSRIKLQCKRFNEQWGDNVFDEVCKEWVYMSDYSKKPWNDSSEQLQNNWRGN